MRGRLAQSMELHLPSCDQTARVRRSNCEEEKTWRRTRVILKAGGHAAARRRGSQRGATTYGVQSVNRTSISLKCLLAIVPRLSAMTVDLCVGCSWLVVGHGVRPTPYTTPFGTSRSADASPRWTYHETRLTKTHTDRRMDEKNQGREDR